MEELSKVTGKNYLTAKFGIYPPVIKAHGRLLHRSLLPETGDEEQESSDAEPKVGQVDVNPHIYPVHDMTVEETVE